MENKKDNRSDLEIIIDREVKIPLYAQITSHIKELINNGELKSGDVLPPIKYLVKKLGLSKTTVKRAYIDLEYEGIIVTDEKSGIRYVKFQGEK